MINPYDGDPKLTLTQNGSTLTYKGGQPVVDQGVENQGLIQLFTAEDWWGNQFLPPEQQVGSDFEETAEGPITLSSLALIQNSAVRALSIPVYPSVDVTVVNPAGDRIAVTANLGPGTAPLSATRMGQSWINEANR